MSHNITLKDVIVYDLDMLASVAQDLSKGLVTLTKDAQTFRTYYGQSNTCDARLNMPGPHDIGLVRDRAKSSYTFKFDPYKMHNVFQAGDNMIGKLVQEYVLRNAEYRASLEGYATERIQQKDGTVTLELVRAA